MERISQRLARTGGRFETLTDLLAAVHDDGDVPMERWPREIEQATRRLQAVKDVWFGATADSRVARFGVPLDALTRDLNVGTATAGGNLVGSPRVDAGGALRGFSVVADAGCTVMTYAASENPPGLPTVATPPAAGWVTAEGGAVPVSDAAFGLRSVGAKTVGLATRVTRRLMAVGGQLADTVIRRELMAALGRAIDRAALQGSGTNGEPLGLTGISGVFGQVGTSLGWAGIQNMLEATAAAGARDANVRFIASPDVRKLLAAREKAAGSGVIWDGATVAGRPADVSQESPAAGIFCGDWSKMFIIMQGDATVVVDRLRVTDGSALLILMVDVDIVVPYAGAFARAVSVT